MVSDARIKLELNNALGGTDFAVGKRISGKVRDSYLLPGGRRALVTTDRVSAFDRILGTIPFKGQVLNQIAAYWFEATKDIVPNHVISTPDPNVMVVAECEQLPLEFIVRGYITGVTETSAWTNYARGARVICGNKLPDGLRKDQKLERPILTPTTKHEVHDRNISRDEAISEGLISPELFDEAAAVCFKMFEAGTREAAKRGLILVDTKYELASSTASSSFLMKSTPPTPPATGMPTPTKSSSPRASRSANSTRNTCASGLRRAASGARANRPR